MNRPTATHVRSITDPIAVVVLVAGVVSLWGGLDLPAVADQSATKNLPADGALRPERVRALVEEFKRARTAEGRDEVATELLAGGPDAGSLAEDIAVIEEVACLLAAPLTPVDRQVVAANAALARELDPEEARGVTRLNLIRMLVGLPAQAIDPKLVAACRVHSRDMEERDFFDHESPVPGRATPWARAEAAGTSASAENIFSGVDDGQAAIQGWWHSPGHHKNMLGGQQRTGLGRWKKFWTQLFG